MKEIPKSSHIKTNLIQWLYQFQTRHSRVKNYQCRANTSERQKNVVEPPKSVVEPIVEIKEPLE